MAISEVQARVVTGLYSLARKSEMLDTPLGRKLFTGSYFLYKRYLEDPFAALVRSRPEFFRNGDILDIGANIGYTAAVFAAAADSESTVYAFEPEPFNFRLLQATLRDRKLESKVVPIQSAVGETTGEIELWINDHHHADHRIATNSLLAASEHAQEKTVRVPIVTVDQFVSQRTSDRPIRLLKIDVQGYELAVCHGMVETLRSQQNASVVVEYMPEAMRDLGYDAPALLTWFLERDFKMYTLGRGGQLTSGISEELAQKGYVDLVFSRDSLT